MVRLYFYVEGQTAQEYVARVLRPHLAGFGVQVMGAVRAASGRKHGHVYRGGGRRYEPMRNDLGNVLREHKGADIRFTTMFDLHALHDGFPGWDEAELPVSNASTGTWQLTPILTPRRCEIDCFVCPGPFRPSPTFSHVSPHAHLD